MTIFSSQKSFNAFAAAFAALCVYQSALVLGATGTLANIL
jgi:hypothetical protein